MGRFQNCCDAHVETDYISMYFKIWTNDILLATYSFLPLTCCYHMYNRWPSLIFQDYYVFWFVFTAFRLDPRQRHGIVMRKQPEDLVLAWPRDLSHLWISTGTATWMLHTTLSLHGWYKEAHLSFKKMTKVWWSPVVQWCSMCCFGMSWCWELLDVTWNLDHFQSSLDIKNPTVWKSWIKHLWNAI